MALDVFLTTAIQQSRADVFTVTIMYGELRAALLASSELQDCAVVSCCARFQGKAHIWDVDQNSYTSNETLPI